MHEHVGDDLPRFKIGRCPIIGGQLITQYGHGHGCQEKKNIDDDDVLNDRRCRSHD
jgi:hypothetical protein